MQAVVERYSRSPYDIKYWEIGNEPDIDYRLPDDPNSIYGCWGDQDDNYYGGGYYAEALSHIYPAIKTADPNSKVLIGGLLLDCNPDNPPPNSNCLPGRFFEGILDHNSAGDGANYFDIVSFHAYPYYYGGNDHGALYQDENNIKWGVSYTSTYTITRGIVLGKLDFLRLKMQAAGIDKPIMQTEGSLLFYCKEINQSAGQQTVEHAKHNKTVERALSEDIPETLIFIALPIAFNIPSIVIINMITALKPIVNPCF